MLRVWAAGVRPCRLFLPLALFSREFGFFRPVISRTVRKYLECGDLEQGFARVRCPDCHHEYLLAFSCRGRWFCPSCHSKKVVQFGSHLQDNVLFPVPHRQYVFSIPKIIRRFFLYERASQFHQMVETIIDLYDDGWSKMIQLQA
jgi:hypothetical protein